MGQATAGETAYRVLRVPQSVVERLYRRAQTRAEQEGLVPQSTLDVGLELLLPAFTQGA